MSGGGMNYAASAMSFAGTLESARAQANTDKYNEKVANNNADAIEQQGTAAVESQARKFMADLGAMKAGYGGSGVDTSMGSPLDVLGASVRAGTLDQLTTKYNYTVAANSQRDQAKLDLLGARNAKTSGFFNALANGLSGLSGQVNTNGYGGPSNYAFGGNALNPNSVYTGKGSFATNWGGDGSEASNSFSLADDSNTYTGPGSTATAWGGFGGGWG